MRIVSWNINSVRARLLLLEQLIADEAPDVLCLQETKVDDPYFPHGWFTERGFEHAAIRGQKGHHGVAILSRVPLERTESLDWCDKGDARHVSAVLPGGAALHNFYVPAGGDVADPDENEKFAHKLQFLDEMIDWSTGLDGPAILVGDLNVAPHEHDVWSHKALLKVVSHTPIETERLNKLQASNAWVDAMRQAVPLPEKLFTWWSYRAKDWKAADKGRRLDHVWMTQGLEGALGDVRVLRNVRGWEKPSDHAPVIFDFNL